MDEAIDKGKKDNWILYLLFFTSTDTLMFGTNGNSLFLYIPRIVGLLAILYLIVFKYKGNVILPQTIAAFSLVIIMVVSGVVHSVLLTTLFSRLIGIFVALAISLYFDRKVYLIAFDNFVYLVSIVAIVTEVVAYIYPSLFSFFPTVTSTANQTYSAFFFGSMRYSFLGNPLIRAGGIFWEPGAFAIYLVLAIMNQLFFVKETNIKRTIVLFAAIIITFSTTGFIALAFLLIIYLLKKESYSLNKKLKLAIVALIILFLLYSIFESSIYNAVFGKIVNRDSTAVWRYSAFFSGMKVALNNPFLGVGANNLGENMAVISSELGYGSQYDEINNNFVHQFAAYGIIYGLIYVIGTLQFCLKSNYNRFISIGFFVTIFFLYFGEVFFSFFPIVFVMYGFSNNNVSNKGEINH